MNCPKCGSRLQGSVGMREHDLVDAGSCMNSKCKVGPVYSIDQTKDPLDTIGAMKQLSGKMLSEAGELEKMWTTLKNTLQPK